ncbi:MAG: ATP-binding protein [Nostoc sp.]|uniref:sensor histidine kinase n=1 Tax=Nostoc sp. TaxID=1180 RepID=UPI002FF9F381
MSSCNPQITIRTELLNSDWVAIEITDNGVGMSQEIQQRLFDPFFTTKVVGKGTGLGMSISYQIVTEKHQGQLRCISSLGEGATFTIEIPIRQNKSIQPNLLLDNKEV